MFNNVGQYLGPKVQAEDVEKNIDKILDFTNKK